MIAGACEVKVWDERGRVTTGWYALGVGEQSERPLCRIDAQVDKISCIPVFLLNDEGLAQIGNNPTRKLACMRRA
eukprot:scaffold56111_cov27-Tisochrysis_lutea.AAC.4